jgi:hypothetical protein
VQNPPGWKPAAPAATVAPDDLTQDDWGAIEAGRQTTTPISAKSSHLLVEYIDRLAAALAEARGMVDASISCAAMGYYKRGDSMHDDYKTVGLNDVLDLRDKWRKAEADAARGRELLPELLGRYEQECGYCRDDIGICERLVARVGNSACAAPRTRAYLSQRKGE